MPGHVDLVTAWDGVVHRKTPAHLAGLGLRPRVWKRLLSVDSSADYRRRRYDQRDDGYVLVQNRTGVG